MNGDELVRRIALEYPEICTIVFSGYDDYKYVINTYKAILSKLLAASSTINTSDDSNTYNTAYNNYSDDNSALGYYKNSLLSTSQSVLRMLNMN